MGLQKLTNGLPTVMNHATVVGLARPGELHGTKIAPFEVVASVERLAASDLSMYEYPTICAIFLVGLW